MIYFIKIKQGNKPKDSSFHQYGDSKPRKTPWGLRDQLKIAQHQEKETRYKLAQISRRTNKYINIQM